MFNLQGSEIVIILLLALVVLGPEKLPDAIRRFGKTYAELKKMGTGFQQEFKAAMDEPVREMRETANLLRSAATDVADSATQAVKPVSPGGPTDLRPATDPSHADPALADVPFADATDGAAAPLPTNGDGNGTATGNGDAAAPTPAAGDAADAATTAPAEPARPPGPAFHSAAPPVREQATSTATPDLEQDGEARLT